MLESKLVLGLSEAPDLREPLENLTEKELLLRAHAERELRAKTERMRVKSHNEKTPWSDYSVTSLESGKSYRVSIRGLEAGQSYCSCPDFKTNHLGTCKHILHVQQKLPKKSSAAQLARPYRRKNISLSVDYRDPLGLRFNVPDSLPKEAESILAKAKDTTLTDVGVA